MEWLLNHWPWYVDGPLIGLTVPALLLSSGKSFGISSSLRHVCSIVFPGRARIAYLRDNDWRGESWNLLFVAGILIGSFVAARFLSAEAVVLLPASLATTTGMVKLFIGGLLVGFGTRYADGCTSGHTITGLSNLIWPSLVATLSFFVGGLLSTALTHSQIFQGAL